MNQWDEFCAAQPRKLATGNYLCDVNELGLILVTGDDAENFLQNQLSNDISHIDENQFQFSAYSTPKGRMLGIFRVIRISNGFLLITPKSLVDGLLQRLQMFVVRAQVSLADASEHFARFTLQTDKAELHQHELLALDQAAVLQNDSVISLRLADLHQQRRYLLLCLAPDEAISLWQEFAKTLTVAEFDSWRLSEINAGIPVVYPQTVEEFVLQMSNLDLLGGVNFKKGCYPGQEIIARMQYLGTLKRRLFIASLDTGLCPSPGDDIVALGAASADGSGKVVDAVITPEGLCHCLYIAQIKKAEAGELCLLDQPQVKFKPLTLPYEVNTSTR